MPKPEEINTIELTKQQYLSLMKMMWLGNWIANAHRDGNPENPHIDEYNEIQNYILSFAKQFGFGKYVSEPDELTGKFYENLVFDEEFDLYSLAKEYDEDMFWDELVNRLAERDAVQGLNREQRRKIQGEEYLATLHDHIEKWATEVNDHGIDRLKVDKDKGTKA